MIKPLPETLGKLWRMPLGNIWSSLKAHCIGIWMFRSKGGRRVGEIRPCLALPADFSTSPLFQFKSFDCIFNSNSISLHFQFQPYQLAIKSFSIFRRTISPSFQEPFSKYGNHKKRLHLSFGTIFSNVLENLSCKRLELKKNKTEVGLDWRITKSGLKKWQRHMSTFSSNEKLECGRLRVKVEMWQGGRGKSCSWQRSTFGE